LTGLLPKDYPGLKLVEGIKFIGTYDKIELTAPRVKISDIFWLDL